METKRIKKRTQLRFLTCCVLDSRHLPRSMYMTFEVMNREDPKENEVNKNVCVFSVSSFLYISSHCQSKSERPNVQDAIKASGALHFPLDYRVHDRTV